MMNSSYFLSTLPDNADYSVFFQITKNIQTPCLCHYIKARVLSLSAKALRVYFCQSSAFCILVYPLDYVYAGFVEEPHGHGYE